MKHAEWGGTHLPWHYDHHMGANQHNNWGVTFQWYDKLRGTRERYVGTDKELADHPRNRERALAAMEGRSERLPSARPGVAPYERSARKLPRSAAPDASP